MKPFEYYKVTNVAQAITLLTKHQEKAAILAGGSDLLGMMKDRLEGPKFKVPQYPDRPQGHQRSELYQGAENRFKDWGNNYPE